MDYQKLCNHTGLEAKWKTELMEQGRDYAIAIRTAHIMQKLGLENVDVIMNDKIEFITSQSPDYNEDKMNFIKYNDWNSGLSQEEIKERIQHYINRGMSEKEAEEYCERNRKIAEYFNKNEDAGLTFVKG